jgi:hypothetical protein
MYDISTLLRNVSILMQSTLPLRSPLLSSHLYLKVTFSRTLIKNFIWVEPLLWDHLSYKAIFSFSQRWPLNTGLIINQSLITDIATWYFLSVKYIFVNTPPYVMIWMRLCLPSSIFLLHVLCSFVMCF